jgi:alpha-L-fucosidase
MAISHGETTTRPVGRALPTWYDDAKFGIFIHWGPFAIPGFAPVDNDDEVSFTEYYAYWMNVPGSATARFHAREYGDLPYEAFAERFRAGVPLWDPDEWAELFERAGARYVVLTAKTDDGFLLWPSAHPNPRKAGWQVQRDLIGELAAAVRARGLRFGLYYQGIDWAFAPDQPKTRVPQTEEWGALAGAHWRELIERYELDVLWEDSGFPASGDPEGLFRWYYERVPDGVVNDRFVPEHAGALFEAGHDGSVWRDFHTVESVRPQGLDYTHVPLGEKWEACREMGWSWGFNRLDSDVTYAPGTELVQELIDVVARNGNLLLNVGPTGAGEIPFAQAQRLETIGLWLRRNGAAIYGTRCWERPVGETADGLAVRYTASPDAVHAIVLAPHGRAALELDARLPDGAEVTLEGRPAALRWEPTAHGTRVELPEPADETPALALRLRPREGITAGS